MKVLQWLPAALVFGGSITLALLGWKVAFWVALSTVTFGVVLCAFVPRRLRPFAVAAWLRTAGWLHVPAVVAPASQVAFPDLAVTATFVAGVIGAAAWITSYVNPRTGLRRFEHGGVSFLGISVILFPMNVTAAAFAFVQLA